MSAGDAPRDPEELDASGAPAHGEISSRTTLGEVHLTVSNLDRSINYHRDVVGLQVLRHEDDRAILGVGDRSLLVLVEEAGAQEPIGHTGLYHFALLVPQRLDLTRWLGHAVHRRVALVGLSDHFVSEAVYLRDPDGHGIEIYWDRPREVWENLVAERMTTLPLDVTSLLGELNEAPRLEYRGLPPGTVMGHVHLRVAKIADTVDFYRDVLGLGLMARLGQQAAFFGAGGYHHHIGANTWESAGGVPAPPGRAALRHATIVLADEPERDRVLARLAAATSASEHAAGGPLVRDPSGNALILTVA